MTAEKKVTIIVLLVFIIAFIGGVLIQKKLHKCEVKPCQLDSLITVIAQQKIIESKLKDSLLIRGVAMQMMKESYTFQLKMKQDEINSFNDTALLNYWKRFSAVHHVPEPYFEGSRK